MVFEFKAILNRYPWISPSLIFLSAFAFSTWFWPGITFPDGDSYYHVKMTELLARGIPRDFPWLPFTTLADNYIDHHFLYHVALFPFVKFFGPFVGIKIATFVFIGTAFTLFYLFLRKLKFVAPAFFTLLLLTSPTFMLRMNLAKAPPFSLIFVILGLLFIAKRKPIALGVLSFLYVWAYGGWPILSFTLITLIFGQSLIQALFHFDVAANFKRNINRFIKTLFTFLKYLFSDIFSKPNRKILVGALVGSILGIIINPFFPKNLFFYWMQFVQIGVVNYASKINVGAEWYDTPLDQLFASNVIIFLIFLLALVLMMLEAKRLSALKRKVDTREIAQTFAFLFLACVFFILTIRSRRNIEYFIPFFVIAIAALFTLSKETAKFYAKRVDEYFASWFSIIHIFTISLLVATFVPIYLSVRDTLINGYSPSYLKTPMEWLKTNAPSGSILFHTNWDNFPMMFYHNDSLRYISGLDSTFFYLKDKQKYELWRKLVWNEYAGDAAKVIKENFGASYVFITRGRGHDFFELQMRLSKSANKVYEDDDSIVFILN